MIGFVNVFKPEGETSSRTVQFVKHVLINKIGCDKKIKVGHFGTLDPEASGVLPIAVGNACRLFDYSLNKRKVYRAEVHFGLTTDTLDIFGNTIEEVDVSISSSQVESIISSFPREYDQIPPNVSAKSVGGVRAYKLVRQGVDFTLPAKRVSIYELRFLGQSSKNVFEIEVECSAGTYIRSLCRDLGEALGVPACMGKLLRLKSGEFSTSNSVTKEDFEKNPEKYIIPVDILLTSFLEYKPCDNDLIKMKNGVLIDCDLEGGLYKIFEKDIIVGLAEVKDGKIKFTTRLQ